ncbi:MAG: hypothetical protein Q9214_005987 [Letrouitia sp. 1 TL-2023]
MSATQIRHAVTPMRNVLTTISATVLTERLIDNTALIPHGRQTSAHLSALISTQRVSS